MCICVCVKIYTHIFIHISPLRPYSPWAVLSLSLSLKVTQRASTASQVGPG